MKDLLDKISSYNLFNYLLPGILFSIIVSKSTEINLIQDDIITGAFLYYFIGLVVSRVGSLLLEPILKNTKFVKFADYGDFVKASKEDSKLETLSESNNMYRTLASLFITILLSTIYLHIASILNWSSNINYWVTIILLLIMFLFAYRKQTNYITKRIKSNLK